MILKTSWGQGGSACERWIIQFAVHACFRKLSWKKTPCLVNKGWNSTVMLGMSGQVGRQRNDAFYWLLYINPAQNVWTQLVNPKMKRKKEFKLVSSSWALKLAEAHIFLHSQRLAAPQVHERTSRDWWCTGFQNWPIASWVRPRTSLRWTENRAKILATSLPPLARSAPITAIVFLRHNWSGSHSGWEAILQSGIGLGRVYPNLAGILSSGVQFKRIFP